MWLESLIRSFCISIDNVIYGAITDIYDLLLLISRTSILSQADITLFTNRIYELLAIFMIFKVTLSLITYVVNPDSFTEKGKGIGPLVRNIIISLSLLVLSPYIFNMAFELQTYILEGNTIPKLIFGQDDTGNIINSAGQEMAFITMNAFVSPNAAISGMEACTTLYQEDGKLNPECTGVNYDDNGNIIEEEADSSATGMLGVVGEKKYIVHSYVAGVNNQDYNLAFKDDLLTERTSEKEFIMNYSKLLSTAVGIVILLILITFCMDIAVRSLKLSFYQMISPIPIISYIDPNGGKDGMFKKWYKACFSTYLSLFLRLFVIYFAIYLIDMVGRVSFVDIITGELLDSKLLKVFIIIGVLMFAKQLPKILEGLGLKIDGSGFTLNPLKKLDNEAAGFKKGRQLLGRGAAVLGAGAAAGTVNFGSRLAKREGLAKALGSGIAGSASATFRGATKMAKGEKAGKIFTNSYGEAMFAKLQNEDLKRKGSTFGGRLKADAARWTGNLNKAQQQVLDYAAAEQDYKNKTEAIKAQKEATDREKNNKLQKLSNRNHALSNTKSRLDGYKKDGINVKDQQAFIDDLQRNGQYYVKKGDIIKAQEGDKVSVQVGDRIKAKVGDKVELETRTKTKDGRTIITKSEHIVNEADVANGLTRIATQADVDNGLTRIATQADVDNGLTRKATAEDAAKLIPTETAQKAEEKLKEEHKKAYKALIEEDTTNGLNDLQQNIDNIMKEYNVSGASFEDRLSNFIQTEEGRMFNVDNFSMGNIKAALGEIASQTNAINESYFLQEQEFAEAERQAADEFKDVIAEKGLDKSSKEWIGNEADNASRMVTTPQQAGWMPTPEVNATSYARNYGLQGAPDIAEGLPPRSSGGRPRPPR